MKSIQNNWFDHSKVHHQIISKICKVKRQARAECNEKNEIFEKGFKKNKAHWTWTIQPTKVKLWISWQLPLHWISFGQVPQLMRMLFCALKIVVHYVINLSANGYCCSCSIILGKMTLDNLSSKRRNPIYKKA